MFKFNNKNTKTTSLTYFTLFLVFLLLNLNKHINVSWTNIYIYIYIFIKQKLFLTTFNRFYNYVASIDLLLFSNQIANIGCVAYGMNFSFTKVSIVISNTLESISYYSYIDPQLNSNSGMST